MPDHAVACVTPPTVLAEPPRPLRRRRWFTVLATMAMPVCLAGSSWADECAVLPRPDMRLRLTLKAEGLPLVSENITRFVTRVWGDEGVKVTWLGATDRLSWDGLDLWIHARRTPVVKAEHALGSVTFVNGVPQRFIQVSIDNTVDLVKRNLSQRLLVQPTALSDLLFAGAAELVERSLGYTIAHEIGHYVLAVESHAKSGLMRAEQDPVASLLHHPPVMRLDEKSHSRLRERMALGARCR